MVNLLHYIGTALVGMVIFQLSLVIIGTLRRQWAAGAVQEEELNLFRERLATVQARRRKVEDEIAPWMGFRKFVVSEVVDECAGVKSFHLKPHDQKPLASFRPGQFLTFSLDVPGQAKKVVRCYSLSDQPRDAHYRVTIKRLADGVGSGFFHDSVGVGSILNVKAPSGGFFLDTDQETPVVLIGGGVGITPLLSMLNGIVDEQPARKVWLFFGVRSSADHIMKGHLEQVAREASNVEIRTFYSRPGDRDQTGKDYDFGQRMSLEHLRKELPSNNFEFYLCGGGEMMSEMIGALKTWGVPEKHIHKEAFGPASIRKPAKKSGVRVIFAKSGKTVEWTGEAGSLLELAECSQITSIDSSGCHAGSCGTCKTAIKGGEITYVQDPSSDVEAGSCLTCISVPESDVTLDA
jgi:uncharacterized protein